MKRAIEVLIYLIENSGKRASISKISRELKMDYKNTYTIIQELAGASLLILERFGRTLECILHRKMHPMMFEAEYYRRESLMAASNFNMMFESLKKVNGQFILLLFGSRAKGTATRHSDIDLLLIADNPEEIRKEIRLMPLDIHLTHVTYEEFGAMLKSREQTVVSEAVKKNIILFGIEDYYRLVENAK